MKNPFLLFLTAFISFSSYGQSCDQVFPFTKGVELQLVSYDHKDTKTGSALWTVTEIKDSLGIIQASVHGSSLDEQDNKTGEGNFKVICYEDRVALDLSSFFDQLKAAGLGSLDAIEIKMVTSTIDYPKLMQINQPIKNAEIRMVIIEKSGGKEFGTITLTYSKRIIESKETVITPAGTFDCYKITSEASIDTKLNLGMSLPTQKFKQVDYFSKGPGLVKSQQLDEKGKLKSYMLLNKIKP